jgi:hypothetical protein
MATGRGTPWSLWYKQPTQAPLEQALRTQTLPRIRPLTLLHPSPTPLHHWAPDRHRTRSLMMFGFVEPARGVLVLVALLC